MLEPFFADQKEFLEETFAKYSKKRSAIMPLLRKVQNSEGYVSDARIAEIAELIESTPTEVKSVMSFYSTYSAIPTGKYHLQVCMTLPCALAGSDELWDYLCEKLDIGQGEIREDGLFSLQGVECLGSCGTAPMLQVSDDGYFECLTKKRLQNLLDELKTRGDGSLPEADIGAPVFFGENLSQETFDGRVIKYEETK